MTTANIESALREAVSAERLHEHLVRFSTLFRDSGSADEWTAAEYIHERMLEYGLRSEILSFDSLISWPLEGTLTVLDDQGNEVRQIPVRTRAFGAKTEPGGIEAELDLQRRPGLHRVTNGCPLRGPQVRGGRS